MNILNQSSLAAVFVISLSCFPAYAGMDDECPTEIINFWKTFARNSENLESIPGFLLTKGCLRSTTSPEFYTTTLERLDNPENEALVGKLYVELTWTDGYKY